MDTCKRSMALGDILFDTCIRVRLHLPDRFSFN